MQACMVAHEEEQVRKCQDLLNYGESEDPAKMTDSKMALIERGPSSRQPTRKLMNEISIHVCNLCGQHEPAPAPCVRQASNAYHLLDQSERPRPNQKLSVT